MSFWGHYLSKYMHPEDMLSLVTMSMLQIMSRFPLAHHTYWINIIIILFLVQVLGESSFASIGPADHELIVVAATICINLTSQTIMISNSRESLLIASKDDSGTSQGTRKWQKIQVAQSSLATAMKEAVDEARMQWT